MNKKSLYQSSWIRPNISWLNLPESTVLRIDATDRDLVELIANGRKSVLKCTKEVAECVLKLSGPRETLVSSLTSVVNVHAQLHELSPDLDSPDKVVVYLHGAIHLLDEGKVAVIVGSSPYNLQQAIWLTPASKQAAQDAWDAHCQALQQWREKQEAGKRDIEGFIEHYPAEEREKMRSMSMMCSQTEPIPDACDVVSVLSKGVLVPMSGKTPKSRDAKVIASLANTLFDPPRDGEHEGIIAKGHGTKHCSLVTWVPRGGLPPYPEVLQCLKSRLCSAFSRPRRNDVSQPEFAFPPPNDQVIVTGTVTGIGAMVDSPDNQLHDLSFPLSKLDAMAEAGRNAVRESGFDAFGWYQSCHIWDDDTWGIYLVAEKLDDLACALHEDLRQVGERSQALATLLAVDMVYQHELFHARVEAVACWLEITALQPRLRRYQRNVYEATIGKDECLEEALANWSARSAILSKLPTWSSRGLVLSDSAVVRVIDANLDLSPPGYKNWRSGANRTTWRQFATELVEGKPTQALKSLPLTMESLFAEPLPFDLHDVDIPTRIVGRGLITDWLLTNPAIFSTPTLREIERALKFFGYQCDKSRGKGSHELWKGNDKRAFPLPRRDPLSRWVFNSFLHHFGIDKMKYVSEIRPRL